MLASIESRCDQLEVCARGCRDDDHVDSLICQKSCRRLVYGSFGVLLVCLVPGALHDSSKLEARSGLDVWDLEHLGGKAEANDTDLVRLRHGNKRGICFLFSNALEISYDDPRTVRNARRVFSKL